MRAALGTWVLLGMLTASQPGAVPPPPPGDPAGLPPPLPGIAGQTVHLAVGEPSRISGNLEVTLLGSARKRLLDGGEAYLADLRVRDGTLAEDITLMSHTGWGYAQGAEFRIQDADPGRKATLLVRPVSPALVPLPFADDTLYLAKVGETGRPLAGDLPGRKEFAAALAQAARQGPQERRWLLYVLVPHALKGTTLAWTDGALSKPLPDPRLLHRMPNSAANTHLIAHLIVDPDSPGTLTAAGTNGETVTFSLKDMDVLRKSPVHRAERANGFPIRDLPAGLN